MILTGFETLRRPIKNYGKILRSGREYNFYTKRRESMIKENWTNEQKEGRDRIEVKERERTENEQNISSEISLNTLINMMNVQI